MASRTSRHDLVGRYLIAPIEDFATERLMETRIRPEWPVHLALALTLAAAFAFTRGWHWPALAALVVSTPLDLIGRRLGLLRLRPLSTKLASKRLLWPAAGLALVALGWWESRHGGGWGALVSAVAAAAFAQAFRLERKHSQVPRQPWFFSRRNAIVAALPFAAFGAWTGYLVAALVYAAASFFVAQFLAHRDTAELTTH